MLSIMSILRIVMCACWWIHRHASGKVSTCVSISCVGSKADKMESISPFGESGRSDFGMHLMLRYDIKSSLSSSDRRWRNMSESMLAMLYVDLLCRCSVDGAILLLCYRLERIPVFLLLSTLWVSTFTHGYQDKRHGCQYFSCLQGCFPHTSHLLMHFLLLSL